MEIRWNGARPRALSSCMTTPRWTAGPVAGLMIISFVLLGSDRAPSIETAALAAPRRPPSPPGAPASRTRRPSTRPASSVRRCLIPPPRSRPSSAASRSVSSPMAGRRPPGRGPGGRHNRADHGPAPARRAVRRPSLRPHGPIGALARAAGRPWSLDLAQVPRERVRLHPARGPTRDDALKLTVVSSEIIDFRAAPRWFNTGCWETSNNPVSTVTTEQPRRPRSGRVTNPFPAGVRVRMCAYQVPPDQRYGDYGAFDYAADLDARQRARLDRALRKVRPAAACDRPATRFGTLFRGDHRLGAVSVELDGCRRMVVITVDGRSTRGGRPRHRRHDRPNRPATAGPVSRRNIPETPVRPAGGGPACQARTRSTLRGGGSPCAWRER